MRLVVTVGSDHHPFDRLIGWVDRWLGALSDAEVDAVFQCGTARPPARGQVEDYVSHDVLQSLLHSADVVVTQGGPMGIIEARQHGIRPIVVPRLARLGEVVDDHQVTFCRHLADRGDITLVEDPASLEAALDEAVTDPAFYRIDPRSDETATRRAVERFAEIVAALPPRRRIFRRQ